MKGRHFGAALAAIFACVAASSASATATLTCDIKDKALEFSLQAAVGTIAASVSGLAAELVLKAAGGQPAQKIVLPTDSLRQQWIDGPELRLWLHADHDEKTPELDLVIVTKHKSEENYAGTYRLTIEEGGKSRKVSGRIACGLG